MSKCSTTGVPTQFCTCVQCQRPDEPAMQTGSANPPLEDQDGAPISEALQDVINERSRQISAEGWTAQHDDQHQPGELAEAAACYASPHYARPMIETAPILWPFDAARWKPKDRRSNLVRAAALLIAEIERLDRKAER